MGESLTGPRRNSGCAWAGATVVAPAALPSSMWRDRKAVDGLRASPPFVERQHIAGGLVYTGRRRMVCATAVGPPAELAFVRR